MMPNLKPRSKWEQQGRAANGEKVLCCRAGPTTQQPMRAWDNAQYTPASRCSPNTTACFSYGAHNLDGRCVETTRTGYGRVGIPAHTTEYVVRILVLRIPTVLSIYVLGHEIHVIYGYMGALGIIPWSQGTKTETDGPGTRPGEKNKRASVRLQSPENQKCNGQTAMLPRAGCWPVTQMLLRPLLSLSCHAPRLPLRLARQG